MKYRIGLTAAAIAVLVLFVVAAIAVYMSNVYQELDPLAKHQWPKTLMESVKAVGSDADHSISGVSVYRVNEVEYLLIAKANDGVLEQLTRRWSLQQVNASNPIVGQFADERFVGIGFDASEKYTYYLSEQWIDGEEGTLYLVAYDKQTSRIVILQYTNF